MFDLLQWIYYWNNVFRLREHRCVAKISNIFHILAVNKSMFCWWGNAQSMTIDCTILSPSVVIVRTRRCSSWELCYMQGIVCSVLNNSVNSQNYKMGMCWPWSHLNVAMPQTMRARQDQLVNSSGLLAINEGPWTFQAFRIQSKIFTWITTTS